MGEQKNVFKNIIFHFKSLKNSNFNHNFIDFSKLVQQRELLDGQLNENKSVLEELNLLKDDNQVSFYCQKKIVFYRNKFFVFYNKFFIISIVPKNVSINQIFPSEIKLIARIVSFQVYKLYGPVLVKQDLEESRQNVGKRMDYIKKELKRCNDQIEELEKKQDKHRENIQKLQQKLITAAGMK